MKWTKVGVRKILPHAMEASKDKNQSVTIAVVLLDNSEVEFQVNKRDRGQVLLDAVFENVRCKEPKFYGLQFPQHVPDAMKWLDPAKSIRKQFKRGYPLLLYYRIKYYIFDINRLKDASTRYQLFLQVRLEILEQRLACSPNTAALLASYAVQSEIGDYRSDQHQGEYLSKFKFIANQTAEFEQEVQKLHRRNKGLSPVQAELLFLQEAKRLNRYGVDIHRAKDLDGSDLEIGVATDGVGLFKNGELCNKYEWSKIVKISFKRKQFYIQLQKDKIKEEVVAMIEFTMDNYRSCKRLWKNCVDCHSFYRQEREKMIGMYRKQGNNVQGKPEKPVFGGFFAMGGKSKSRYDNAERDVLKFRGPQKSLSSKMLTTSNLISNKSNDFPDQETKESRRLSAPPSVTLAVNLDKEIYSNNISDHDLTATSFMSDKVYLNGNDLSQPSLNSVASEPLESYPDCPFQTSQPEVPPKVPEPYVLPDNILLVRLKPDNHGRFGFNIKGGSDQNMPITVSKIAPNSPADICDPRLNIGDEILQINGRDANTLTHDQVVNFIRATREQFAGELVLLTRPFVVTTYEDEDDEMEVPKIENGPLLAEDEISVNSLEYSMSVLNNQLENGRDMAAFDRLYRKKPGLLMKDAKLPHNVPKNRYRDISPYDDTRVILSNWETDYINGNHILMEIPNAGIANHYIACQGPLQNTSGDFWAMVWEQKATLIVMVTTTIERGMIKCFQYWPNPDCTIQFANIAVTSKSETASSCFIFREFEIGAINSDGDIVDKRDVSHIQYVAWPDHGVPDDSSDFLEFILCVRQKRVAMTVPTIVHCSAGIGRTGVMIAVETAMCLIEANQPVFPLQITQNMRDQRAMMIQTALQFRFVCEAILRVYREGIAQPMVGDTDNGNEAEELT
ncbi:tyrosine-protein phosphatase non-receptor type 4-like [Styela clava]|uniref:tyrosine-protein phosphatase non-receptor type 4-like n=1 Tax=Styela clava TaxID=7725 RepID=UPI0019397498|nr:tyrosine-protein phosphatase non-receptor type 4-like [Styela clava]